MTESRDDVKNHKTILNGSLKRSVWTNRFTERRQATWKRCKKKWPDTM